MNTSRPIPQSGVLPYRMEGQDFRLMVIRSSDGLRWGIPKGMVEPAMSPLESAIKEAYEEAGILGKVCERSIGMYAYQKDTRLCEVELFVMEVVEELPQWPEMYRKRIWVSPEEAANLVSNSELARHLRTLPSLVKVLPIS